MPRQDSKTKILDQIHQVLRLHHYAIHTERTYLDGMKRFVAFHRLKSRHDLAGEREKDRGLSHSKRRKAITRPFGAGVGVQGIAFEL